MNCRSQNSILVVLFTRNNQVFMNVEEAEELVRGLKAAIARAKTKNARHPARGINC